MSCRIETVFAIIDKYRRVCALYKSLDSAMANAVEHNASLFDDDGTPDTCGPYWVTTWTVQP